jgi:hypothetical protein
MDIFRRLRQDHARQRDLANRIIETDAGDERREALYRRLKAELESHATAEVRVLYAAVLGFPNCQLEARRGLFAHKAMARQLATLDALDSSSEAWISRFLRLREDMEHHACEEEEFLFPAASECLPPATASLLAQAYDAHKSGRPGAQRSAVPGRAAGSPAGVSQAAY